MRAALLARVSTQGQEDEQTIDSQIDEIRERIKVDGHTLAEEFVFTDDGWSGDILERPRLDAMRDAAKDELFDILYAYDRGRISRKYVYQEIVLDELRSHNIQFVSLHDLNGETPEDRIAQGMFGLFAEYEKVKILERFRRGKLYKARNGQLLGYTPPYGYDYHKKVKEGSDVQNGFFTINEEEAAVVRLIFTWVGEEGIALREVIRRLYERNIMPRKRKQDAWTKGPVIRLCQNQSYVGDHYYNKSEAVLPRTRMDDEVKYRKRVKTGRIKKDRDEWFLIKVPPIVSRELFDKVQARLKQNQKYSQRNNKTNRYLVGGMIYCPCGKTRNGETSATHSYYRCTDRLSRFPLPRVCMERGISVGVLDAAVWAKLSELLKSPQMLQEQAERWVEQSGGNSGDEAVKEAQKALEAIELEEQRYAKALGEGIMSESIYKKCMASVRERKDTLQPLAKSHAKPTPVRPIDAATLVSNTRELLDNLPFADKKLIVRELVTTVTATQKEVTICGQIPIPQDQKVGLRASPRHRRPAQRRQINPL